MKLTSMKVQALCFFVLILVVGTSSRRNEICPFDYIYHFGDGMTDIGNAVLIKPWGPHLPAAHLPYGITYPGYPTGRWGDGRTGFDFESQYYGLPNIVPYLGLNGSTEYDGLMFSVAGSPVLDHAFYKSRGVEIPPYCVSLEGQMEWFREHIKTIAPTPEAVAERLQNSFVLTGDIEGNDFVYPLTQGKSIEEVRTYVPYIVEAQVKVIRELVDMGATRILIPGNVPAGCTPYLLTDLASDNPDDYDDIGCLNTVNELVQYKNRVFQEAVAREFPNTGENYGVNYADNYEVVLSYIRNASTSGPEGNMALKACCGVGGKYNYDSNRFCGSPEATVCSNPGDYFWWDGFHSTQESFDRIISNLVVNALTSLNCNTSAQLSASI